MLRTERLLDRGLTVPGYAASKGGVAQLTKAFANEWAPLGVNVNAIAPGYVGTDMNEALLADPIRETQITARIPAQRWGTPDDMAGAVAFPGLPRRRVRPRDRPHRRRGLARPLRRRAIRRRTDAGAPASVLLLRLVSHSLRRRARPLDERGSERNGNTRDRCEFADVSMRTLARPSRVRGST
jgi:hypothetical protein